LLEGNQGGDRTIDKESDAGWVAVRFDGGPNYTVRSRRMQTTSPRFLFSVKTEND